MFFLWVIIAGLLQTTCLRDINIMAVLAVFSGLRKGPLAGLLIGGVIGILAGIFSEVSFGLNIVPYSLVGFAAGVVKEQIYYKENLLMQFMFSFGGIVLLYLIYFILTNTVYTFIFYTAFLSACLSPIVFRIVGGSQRV